MSCQFCRLPAEQVVAENDLAVAIGDPSPQTKGHSLVITKRHVANWWSASDAERKAVADLADEVKAKLDTKHQPDGYTIATDDGAVAGQTVFHLHTHVIPRYDSQAQQRLSERVSQADLTRHVLALLDEGRRSATYKPALLLALVELAVERSTGSGELQLNLTDVAERAMSLYWQQTRPHPDSALGVLRQATAPKSRIVTALLELRRRSSAEANASLGRVRLLDPEAYAQCVAAVSRALAMQPIPRLQRPGSTIGSGEYPRMLFDDSDYLSERGWVGDGPARVTLKPGVAQALAASAPVLRMAAEEVWTREITAINRLQTEESTLRTFLFGADRTRLRPIADALRDLGQERCFWCDRPLHTIEVDHVIPWSHYPSDDLFNLVLTDPTCNNDKRDRLLSADRIEQWLARDHALLDEVAVDLKWPMDPTRTTRVASAAYRYLPLGIPLWSGVRQLALFDAAQREQIQRALG